MAAGGGPDRRSEPRRAAERRGALAWPHGSRSPECDDLSGAAPSTGCQALSAGHLTRPAKQWRVVVRLLTRAVGAALLGGVTALLALAGAYAFDPWIALEMDRGGAPVATGFYTGERDGETTFAWTRREAVLTLPGLDRRTPWSCTIRLRGARQDPSTLPLVDLAVDGIAIATHQTTNDYDDVTVTLPARPRASGATVALTSSNTFVPGPGDPRTLGVMVDRWTCVPARGHFVLPPPRARVAAATAGATVGAAFALAGLAVPALVAAAVLVAAAQAGPMASQLAPFSPYVSRVPWIALWVGVALVLVVRGTEMARRTSWSPPARLAATIAVSAGYLKLLALLHPSKLVADALFQAHRFEWVLAGRYYFTQIMPGGVEFPYAIGLYLVAAPWSWLTADYVTLLRVIVIVAEIGAGALLYTMAARAWHDGRAGVLAVLFFALVPLPYVIVGNGNLTNAFAQSMGLATVAAATLWPLARRPLVEVGALTLVATLALASHVSTFVLLPPLLVAVAVCFRLIGGPSVSAPARWVAVAAVLATLLATAGYYGHFGETYRNALRIRAQSTTTADASPAAGQARDERAPATPAVSLASRATSALGHTRTALGWPLLLLAALGAWRTWREGARDRLTAAVVAWGALYAGLFVAGLFTRVDAQFERYSVEFMGRVDLATYPAIALLAARGATWGWRAGWLGRFAAAALGLGAFRVGLDAWLGWLR